MATLSAFLDEHRAAVERSRADPEAHAAAALALAELEPVFGSRFEASRVAIEAAGTALAAAGDDRQRARLMLALAKLKIIEGDLEAADRALARADSLAAGHVALKFLVSVRAARVAVRRSAEHRVRAREVLAQLAGDAPTTDGGDEMWQRGAAELALAFAEIEAHEEPPAPEAFATMREVVKELAGDLVFADVVFAGRQLLVLYAMGHADRESALEHARGALQLARDAGAVADEVQLRLTVASMLASDAAPAAKQEAAFHAQRARDTALEHGLSELHRLALIGQAGVLASAGKIAGAIERMVEIAQTAVEDGDVARYVAAVGMMAELYTRAGDTVSAYRTIVESNAALGAALGRRTSEMFAPLLTLLRDVVGPERLDEIAADVARANELAAQLAGSPDSHSR